MQIFFSFCTQLAHFISHGYQNLLNRSLQNIKAFPASIGVPVFLGIQQANTREERSVIAGKLK